MQNVLIIGGGLAGLANALWLAQKGHEVVLLEKNHYPRHKVCGEYVSKEVLPFFEELGLTPIPEHWPSINRLWITAPSGNSMTFPLDLGGFGVSRYQLDHHLFLKAEENGVKVHTGTKVNAINWHDDHFKVKTASGETWESKVVIGNFGKRSNLDRSLQRAFLQKRSPYIGVKHHIKTSLPTNLISLHNAPGAYCGISKVEDDRHCFCYLAHRDTVRKAGGIEAFEQSCLKQNKHLASIMGNSEFLFEQPEVIGEVSFETKSLVQNHILMGGDAAGMIAPLCGNGMAMAFHSAKLLAPLVDQFLNGTITRSTLEKSYNNQWKAQFQQRLQTGRWLQHLLFRPQLSEMAVETSRDFPVIAKKLIQKTHGAPF